MSQGSKSMEASKAYLKYVWSNFGFMYCHQLDNNNNYYYSLAHGHEILTLSYCAATVPE